MNNNEKEALAQEGRNQVLYLLLAIGDENVAHDHWHPDVADILFQARKEIVKRLQHPPPWPLVYPDFKTYAPAHG